MSNPVNVQENIDRLNASIEKFEKDIKEHEAAIEFSKKEILRLEGCLIVFKGFAEAGIKNVVDQTYNECKRVSVNEECNTVHEHEHEHEHERDECDSEKSPLEALYEKYRTL